MFSVNEMNSKRIQLSIPDLLCPLPKPIAIASVRERNSVYASDQQVIWDEYRKDIAPSYFLLAQ
jgi:hypothetical protein